MSVHVSFARNAGFKPVVEVDDVYEAHAAIRTAGFEIGYGPTDEPWGVRRFYVPDPLGTLVNSLSRKA
ncbi:VOC family protein [Rhizobium mesoamericanum]|uniref:VOC family protein n=1 Tax=Rhizobium mesoamericanum TaxID=1079800 RepID=UPI000425B16A